MIPTKLRRSLIPVRLSTPSIPTKPRRLLVLEKVKYFHESNKVKWFKKIEASGKWIEVPQ